MKFKDKNDSIRKVSLIDDLSMGISYNTALPRCVLGCDLSFNLRLKLSKSYTLSMSSTFATYAYEFDENGRVCPVTVRNGRMAVSVVGRDMVRRSVGP